MKTYQVYHLDEKSLTRVNLLKLNKRPERFDQSIIDCYCITKSSVIDVENREIESIDIFNKYKIEQIKLLKDSGAYIHVATVKAKDELDVRRATSNINGYWFLSSNNCVDVHNVPWRGIANNDLVICEDEVNSIVFGIGTINY